MTKRPSPTWFPNSWPRNKYAHLQKIIPVRYADRWEAKEKRAGKFFARILKSVVKREWAKTAPNAAKPPRNIEKLAKVGRLGLANLERDANIFGSWLKSYSPSPEIDYSRTMTLYRISAKKLGRALSPNYEGETEAKKSWQAKKTTRRGIARFFNALLNETGHGYENLPNDLGRMEKLPIKIACDLAIALFWAHLELARKRPALYRRTYHQKPPRNVLDEYVNMVCRHQVKKLNIHLKNQKSMRIELRKKRKLETEDQALARLQDDAAELMNEIKAR